MKFLEKFKSYRTPEEKRELHIQRTFAIIAGIFLGLSFPPIPLPYLMFVALVPYFFVIEKRNGLGELNRITYLMGLVFTIVSAYWVGSWTPEADPFLMIAGTAIIFFNPVMFLIPSTLYYYCKKVISPRAALLLFPLFWVAYEYLYGVTDIKFPWLILGHGLAYFKSYIQIADIVGASGLSLLVIYFNISLFYFIKSFRSTGKINKTALTALLLLMFIPIIYGVIRISGFEAAEKKIKIGVVQPNLNPWNKWEAGNLEEQLNLYLDLSDSVLAKDANLILWPETALPIYLFSGAYGWERERIFHYVDVSGSYLLTGMPDATFYYDKEKAPPEAKQLSRSKALYTSYNSILLFKPGSRQVDKYGKMKLVAFSERVPFLNAIPFLGDLVKWNVGISSWNVGKEQVVFNLPADKFGNLEGSNLLPNDTVKVAGLICFESVFPDFVAEFVQKGAQLITIVTNDSWWGNTSGPYQHKEIGVLRAVENKRFVVRAANGGVSCLINPIGMTIANTEMFERTSIVVEASLENDLTFYSRFPLMIPFISLFASIAVVIIFIFFKIKKFFLLKINRG